MGEGAASAAKALLLGSVGGVAAFLLSFPAPFLTGPVLVVAVASLLGQKLSVPDRVRDLCFMIIGMTMGAGVSSEVLETVVRWPLSFAGLALGLLVIIFLGRWVFMTFWHYDQATATLASMPGHLSYVIGISTETEADVAKISVIQSMRVVALTLVVPFAVMLIGFQDDIALPPRTPMPLGALLISLAGAAILGAGLRRANLQVAYLIGGMLITSTTHLAGWFEGAVPMWLAGPSFVAMGTIIGTRFSGQSLADLRRVSIAGVTFTVIAFAVASAAALLVSTLLDMPAALLLIAFAPGGVEAMAAMALALGADPAFVAAHHVFRLFLLVFLAPASLALSGRLQDWRASREPSPGTNDRQERDR